MTLLFCRVRVAIVVLGLLLSRHAFARISDRFCEVKVAVAADGTAKSATMSPPEQPPLLLAFKVQEYRRRTCAEACEAHGGRHDFRCVAACDTSSVYCECDESSFKQNLCGRRLGSKMCDCSLVVAAESRGRDGDGGSGSGGGKESIGFATPKATTTVRVPSEDQAFARSAASALNANPRHDGYLTLVIKAATAATTTIANGYYPPADDIVNVVRGGSARKESAITPLDILALRVGGPDHAKLTFDVFDYARDPASSVTDNRRSKTKSTNKRSGGNNNNKRDNRQADKVKALLPVPLMANDTANPWFEPAAGGRFVLDTPGKCHGSLCHEHIAAAVRSGRMTEPTSGFVASGSDRFDDSDSGTDPASPPAFDERLLDFEVLSEEPRVFYYPNFLTDEEVGGHLSASPCARGSGYATCDIGVEVEVVCVLCLSPLAFSEQRPKQQQHIITSSFERPLVLLQTDSCVVVVGCDADKRTV